MKKRNVLGIVVALAGLSHSSQVVSASAEKKSAVMGVLQPTTEKPTEDVTSQSCKDYIPGTTHVGTCGVSEAAMSLLDKVRDGNKKKPRIGETENKGE